VGGDQTTDDRRQTTDSAAEQSPSSGPGRPSSALRHIRLCADDYGIALGVNAAIRDLIVRGRLNATSVMVAAPGFTRAEARSLAILNSGAPRAAIGLHVTLTAPFRPLTQSFRPLPDGAFPPLRTLVKAALLRRLSREAIAAEIDAQLTAFAAAFGRAPDFIDGHQHVQLYPQVRDAFLAAVKEAAPSAWVRQCGRSASLVKRLLAGKALLLDVLSAQFRRRASRAGIAFNPAFAGAYDFSKQPDFGMLMQQFLNEIPEHGVIMCHPGFVDDVLTSLDPLTRQREKEHAFLASAGFQQLLAANDVTLAELASCKAVDVLSHT
jgi:predicted glycoside hydrolase/deacetylase ChbG (UPF0249 family)